MRQRSGFTLVELLLFTGIIAVMAGALVGFSLVSTNLSTRSEVTAEVEENAAIVSQRIVRETRNADIIAHPAAGATADSLVLVQLDSNRRPQREVMIGLYRDRVRLIENQSGSSFLTTGDMGVSNLAFLHFAGQGTGTGVSAVFRAFNKAAGAGVAANQYARNFRGTAALHPSRCSQDTDCPTAGDKCCGGACAAPVGGNCPACVTSADCAAPACALATCDYNVQKCVGGACTAVDTGPCDSCSRCGDGFRDEAALEKCDDGNAVNSDACTCACAVASCGDGAIQPLGADGAAGGGDDEQCDDGNLLSGDGCSATCQSEDLCGGGSPNGAKAGDEECDDGNGSDADACDVNCRVTVCGDGIVQNPNGQGIAEECDDGNTLACDLCSSTCQNVTPNECGNAIQEGAESCDDGRRCTVTGDPCSADADCTGVGNVCRGFSADSCTTPSGCVPTQTPEATCNDSLDNDCDSLIDCADTANCPNGTVCAVGKTCQGGSCVAASAVCGNGTAETGESCGEPGLSCGGGQTCRNCTCYADGACSAGQACSRVGGVVTGCGSGGCGACFYCVDSSTNVVIGDGQSGVCRAFSDTVAGPPPGTWDDYLARCFEHACCSLAPTCSINNNSTPGQASGNCS